MELENNRPAASLLGMATKYLAAAGEELGGDISLAPDDSAEKREKDWGEGAAGWAVAAATVASGRSLDEILDAVEAFAHAPEPRQGPASIVAPIMSAFGILGTAVDLAGQNRLAEAGDEAIRSAAVIIGALEEAATGIQ